MFRPIHAILPLVLAMALAGCFGRNTPSATPTAMATPTVAADSGASAPATATPEAAMPTATAPGEPATAAPEEPAAAGPEEVTLQTVEEAPHIQRYRVRITIHSESPRGVDEIQVNGAYVKEPPAEHIQMAFTQGDQVEQLEIVLADGMRYVKSGDLWVAAPDAKANLQELTLITPQALTDLGEAPVLVGQENLDGQELLHYRVAQEAIPVVGTEGDTLDVSQADSAQLDFWVDLAEQVIVKMALTMEDAGTDGGAASKVDLTFEYYDLNGDIVIHAPENVLGAPGAGAPAPGSQAGDGATPDISQLSPTRQMLYALFGFDLLLPTGTDYTLLSEQFAEFTAPYTREEAIQMFETVLPANGYTLVSKLDAPSGETVLMFQKDGKTLTIAVSTAEDAVRVQVVSAP
ncbi:hypothetical protein FKZ61_021515 [Litorilinea aerophila]|uniref:LppX_LprAFG lipoprotein n=1 Tax=Litorilinea aerophila TaxID=1204385 RepID=A0A540V9H8_9CHLR|nr:hypothetical protein [Litorilinea aerophila]MCC9078679.1 hypothetical protein [Litorilinea aerophila]OUC06778.1 hypothetical protein RY27_18915 [Litorilinea aerophila]